MGAPSDALQERFTPEAWGMEQTDFDTKIQALEAEAIVKTAVVDAQVAWVLYRGYDLEITVFRRTPQTRKLGPGEVNTDLKTVLASLEQERYAQLQRYNALVAVAPEDPVHHSANIPAKSGW